MKVSVDTLPRLPVSAPDSPISLIRKASRLLAAPPGSISFFIVGMAITSPFASAQGVTFTGSGAVNFGTANVCPSGKTVPAPCSETLTLTYNVTASGTLGTPQALTTGAPNLDYKLATGSTCVGSVSQGNTCKVNVTFAPIAPGARNGAVEIVDSSGNVLATTYIYGTGTGPAVAFSPSAYVQVGGPFADVGSMTVDASENVYITRAHSPGVEEILAAGGYTTINTLGGSLGNVGVVAVDGAGNLIVADGQEVDEILRAGGYTTVNTLGYGDFYYPTSVAVDGSGNVFVADTENNAVKELVAASGYNTVKVLGSGFVLPGFIAIDGSGNVFVTDEDSTDIKEITAASGYTTVRVIGRGFADLNAIAVDASGSVYVAEYGGNVISEILAAGDYTTVSIVASNLKTPTAMAVDAQGNVYFDDAIYGLTQVSRSQPLSRVFGSANVGATSSPLPTTVQNVGNANLVGTSSVSLNWGQVAGSGTPADCAASLSLVPGAECNLSISFEPTEAGDLTGAATLADNALNQADATQTIPLSGTGVNPAAPVINMLSTTYGAAYSRVVLTGANFGPSQGSSTVTFNNVAAPVYQWSDTGILVTVPANATTGNIVVTVKGVASIPAFFTVLPLPSITGISPTVGTVGTIVFIAGNNLLDYQNNAVVTFNGTLLPIVSQSSTVIKVAVPAGAVTGEFHVVVNDTGINTPTFTLTATLAFAGTGAVDFGTVNVCPSGKNAPAPCNKTLTLTYDVTTSGPLGTPQALTTGQPNFDYTLASGSTCVGSVIKGNTCTVNVTFAPIAPGARNGAFEFVDSSGDVLVNTYIHGTGVGPLAGFIPPVERVLGSGFVVPDGVAVDASGNVFISEFGHGYDKDGTVKELLAVNGSIPANPVIKVLAGGQPLSVALDGAGNVFYSDNLEHAVWEIFAAGGFAAGQVLGYDFNAPGSLAVDGSGNVFVIDQGYVKEIPAGPGYTPAKTIGGGVQLGNSLALDNSGNVFVAGQDFNEIMAAGGYNTVRSIPFISSGYTYPSDIAIDPAGNLFVTFDSPLSVAEFFAIDGVLPPNPAVRLVATGFRAPEGIALDGLGNVYVADADDNTNLVKELQLASPPPLAFATTAVGHTSSDSPQSVEIQNQGNATLNATALSVSPNWDQVAGTGTPEDCPASFSLVGGALCNLSISFKPTETGALTGAATLVDNSLNDPGSTQPVPLSGTSVPTLSAPHITSLNTAYGAPYSAVILTGTNFRASRGSGNVIFNGIAAPVYYWSDTEILATVPGNASTGNVFVNADGEASNAIPFTVLPMPTITGISPTSGPVGTVVTISGNNLLDYENKGTVTLNGKSLPIISQSSSAIKVAVPTGAVTGDFHVLVNDTGINTRTFTVTQ